MGNRAMFAPGPATPPADLAAMLSRNHWFHDKDPEFFAILARHSFVRGFRAGELIYAAGDPPGYCFAVLSGQIRLSHFSEGGRQVLFSISAAGDWFGELSEIDQLPRFHTAATDVSTRLLIVPHAGLTQILREAPEFREFITLLLCHHLRSALQMLVETKVLPVQGRIARALISSYRKENDDAATLARLTHADLASIVGASRQAVSNALHRMQKDKLIRLHYRRIELLDISMLRRLARRE